MNRAEQRRTACDAETRGDQRAADTTRATTFDVFAAMVAERLKAGRRAYGDASFARDPADLAGEIEEELADVAGWAFILWTRVRRLKERLDGGLNANAEGK
jgi:NTP pyrophosphatase (non-canonical NTP hydrolase)